MLTLVPTVVMLICMNVADFTLLQVLFKLLVALPKINIELCGEWQRSISDCLLALQRSRKLLFATKVILNLLKCSTFGFYKMCT